MKNQINRPRIFVGSSSEARKIDTKVRSIIDKLGGEAVSWQDIAKPGDYMLDILISLASSIDGALLIATPDDLRVYRSVDDMVPRDNIILEFGIFVSKLGKHRTGIVRDLSSSQSPPRLPSDLHGLTTIEYFPDKPAIFESKLEGWLEHVLDKAKDKNPHVNESINILGEQLSSLPISWRETIDEYLLIPFKTSISLAMKGEIYLSAGEYYHALYSAIEEATSQTEVLAVSTLPPIVWMSDSEQKDYLKRNLKAAERRVNIRRIFVLPGDQWKQIKKILWKHLDKGIKIHMSTPNILGEFRKLEDMVIFRNAHSKESHIYIAELAVNPTHIKRGRVILNEDLKNEMINDFEKAWFMSIEINNQNIIPKLTTVKKLSEPPSVYLKEYKLDKPVVTCMEASRAKVMPLENELKTLIYTTPLGYVAVEIPGSANASLRKIKDALEVKNAQLASEEELIKLGLEPGTICSVKSPVWDFQHLVSRRLLNLKIVSTNSGHKKGFYRFSPSLLYEAEKVLIGDFEEETTKE